MVAARDHGHTGGEVPDHVVSGLTHPVLVMVQREILLDDLLARRQGNLDGALNDGRQIFLREISAKDDCVYMY